MEVASGVISLAWDVFDTTVRIFNFVTALVDMPREYEQYRLQLIIEYNRVLAWGKAAGLVEVPEGSTLGATLGADGIELVAIVARIQWLLSEFRDLNARYGNQLPQSAPKEGDGGDEKADEKQPTNLDVLKAVSSLAVSYEAKKREHSHRRGTNHIREFFLKTGHHTKAIVTHPVRVRWVAVDKDGFEALLKDLHVLTERLHELMRNHRQQQLDDVTAKTYREMILTRNNVQELKDMLDAVTSLISTSSTTRADRAAHRNDRALQDLIQLKRIAQTSESILAQLHRDGTLDVAHSLSALGITVRAFTDAVLSEEFEWNEADADDPACLPRPRGILSTDEGHVPVWIEWKAIGDAPAGSPRDKECALRTVALAQMLHLPKPATLHAPECVGYFDDREVSGVDRYGWVFKMPEGADYDTRVISLYEVLGVGRYKPSLAERVAMAECLCATVVDLHAVNWLHKGIFSDNVVFHFSEEEEEEGKGDGGLGDGGLAYGPANPLLCGFEFSRPDGKLTTARDVDSAWDLYRWPGIQRQRPTERNSKKTYDLYSLGLLLLEIAHWERLHTLMNLGQGRVKDGGEGRPAGVPDVPLQESKMVRDWLLGVETKTAPPFEAAGRPNPLRELRNVVGDRYWRVVERCVWAHGEKGFGVDEAAEQSNDGDVGVVLQEAFTERVVEELRAVRI
ncbi:prion-inhibition and propagation-domain-containing protein [Staphylotrichum tortipilum]|uniref:Prion-inhibition and propagation-domain-containing protein n=1 Tax=Staphylotrichum tortipilum TaxID=2831512 RepID=A0AAN6MRC9_9PEZI|nr:prion-inhibition and propagation-domain-containing protein [Staphylotrichum longicolle]